jgi:sugar O-acyltransferase (sialic acid O-acetyltransferase NeuD family)
MLIFGSSGFAQQLLPSLHALGILHQCVFFDNITKESNSYIHSNFRVINSFEDAFYYFNNTTTKFSLGIGGPETRKIFSSKFKALGGELTSILDPSARISPFGVKLGEGINVLQDVIIEPNVTIGEGVILNVRSTVTHDCIVGDFCEISPSAILLGGVKVGKFCFIGAGAILLPRVEIGDNCVIGAGAVVTKSIDAGQKVAGVPAQKI